MKFRNLGDDVLGIELSEYLGIKDCAAGLVPVMLKHLKNKSNTSLESFAICCGIFISSS